MENKLPDCLLRQTHLLIIAPRKSISLRYNKNFRDFKSEAARDRLTHAGICAARGKKSLNESGAGPLRIVRQRLTYPPLPRAMHSRQPSDQGAAADPPVVP